MKQSTSWEKDSAWYSKKTAGRGNYYHEHLVIPNAIRLLRIGNDDRILDLACGSGVLGRAVRGAAGYTGIDIAPSLVASAKRQDTRPRHEYIVGDVTNELPVPNTFTRAAVILAIQNVSKPNLLIANAAKHILPGGIFVIVMNHPAFRIPRQSSWGTDLENKLQYRRVNRYLSPLEIPVTMHPGQSGSAVTWSYHQPLSVYARMLHDSGFAMLTIEEWASDKESAGRRKTMENRARSEFPLFLAIQAVKTDIMRAT